MSKKPSSRDPGFFKSIDLVAFQTGVATYMTALREGVPPDPTFPETSFDPVTRGTAKIMAKSITAKPKKRGRPSTGGRDPMIGARFPEALTEAIDKWAASNGDIGRSEAMRRLVELGLRVKGKGAMGGRGRS